MGEPATPSPKEREATRKLAREIVESVRNDEAMPLPAWLGDPISRVALEEFIFELAQEITLQEKA